MMKIKAMALAAALMIGSVITAVALVLPNAAATTGGGNDNKTVSKQNVLKSLTIQLQCDNGGGHQDVAKTPFVTNSTGKTLPKGRKLFWQSSDGDKGVIELDAALKPGKTAIGRGRPGQNYTCTATTSAF